MNALLSIARHRTLIWLMVRRDLQGRYRGSVLGLLWTVASPLFMIAVFTLFYGVFLQIRPSNAGGLADFGLFIMAGLVPWTAFSEGLSRATSVVLDNRVLVKRVVFPLEILPVNMVMTAVVGELIGLALLAIALLFMLGRPPLGLLLVPVVLLPQLLLTLGLAWLLASLGVFLRDLAHAINLVILGWMFLTPIFYAPAAVPAELRWLVDLNPMAHLILGYRAVLLGDAPLDGLGLGLTSAFSLLICLLGGLWFMRTKHAFVDVV